MEDKCLPHLTKVVIITFSIIINDNAVSCMAAPALVKLIQIFPVICQDLPRFSVFNT